MTTSLTPLDSTHVSLLVRLAKNPDQNYWDEFYDRYGELIRGYCHAANRYRLEVDELIQEVFHALLKSLPKFQYDKAKGKFRGYLFHVTHNKAMELSRKRSRNPISLDAALSAEVEDEDELEAIWDTQWKEHLLRQAHAQLEREFPKPRIELFKRYALDDDTVEDVAKEFDCSVAMVYKTKSLMTQRMQEIIVKLIDEEG